MGNVLRILKRDVLRLLKTPAALVVVLALLVLPSMYAWYNVIGFWDPYGHTGNLRVCVVNEDAGAQSDLTGELNVGDQVVEELKKNDQLGWQFVDRDTAMQEVRSGESYAAFVIPSDFSSDLLTIVTGDFTQPDIEYYVNEKAGPVSPKITDAGATTLDETVNETFVSTVSAAAASALDEGLDLAGAQAKAAYSEASARLSDAAGALDEASSAFSSLSGQAQQLGDDAAAARDAVAQLRDDMGDVGQTLARLSELAGEAQGDLASFSATALPLASDGIGAVASLSDGAHSAAADMQEATAAAQVRIAAAAAQASQTAESGAQTAARLDELLQELPDGSAGKEALAALVSQIEQASSGAQTAADDLSALSDSLSEANKHAEERADELHSAADQAVSAMQQASDGLFGGALPALSEGVRQLGSLASELSAATARQDALIMQASSVLDELSDVLTTAQQALSQTGDMAAEVRADLDAVQTDLAALGGADAVEDLVSAGTVDPEKIAEFMGSPTKLETVKLYEPVSYGAAMAPLFMNLTFWIGAFMLVVILKVGADGEGVRNLTLTQRYLGRFSLFAILAMLQAAICCAGIAAIGVQPVNFPALVFAACATSLAYLSIIYALSVTLQHIGMGLCIALVFVQIPGATGLYPIEMTSGFFQAIYPFFPFTYGIAAMREAICGFYGSHYTDALCMLALFFAVFMAIGILLRPLMANVNRMTARQIEASGIFNGEDAEVPARRFRLSQLVRVLADKEEYRAAIEERYARFERMRPRLIAGSIVAGIAVPVVLLAVFALTPTEKVVLLTIWIVFVVVLFVALIVIESLRDSFERQLRLSTADVDELQDLYEHRNSVEPASKVLGSGASAAPVSSADDGAPGTSADSGAACESADAPDASPAEGGDRA